MRGFIAVADVLAEFCFSHVCKQALNQISICKHFKLAHYYFVAQGLS